MLLWKKDVGWLENDQQIWLTLALLTIPLMMPVSTLSRKGGGVGTLNEVLHTRRFCHLQINLIFISKGSHLKQRQKAEEKAFISL